MKHRILVAGGAGYIGSHVQKQLLEDGFEVAVFDDLSSGDRKIFFPAQHLSREIFWIRRP